jgi:hypothetical protein
MSAAQAAHVLARTGLSQSDFFDPPGVQIPHWSSAKFSSTWHDTFSILLARGRAQVSVAASRGDWPKRAQDQAYSDQNHASAA